MYLGPPSAALYKQSGLPCAGSGRLWTVKENARGTEVDDWARMAKEPLLRWCGRSSCHVHVG